MPLRAHKSRRCKVEVNEGKPGILLKPKLNPLEGDSSLRSGHGQWWKKDSSALHVIPKISVVDLDPNNTCILLKVTNPTMSHVKLWLGPSSYTGDGDAQNNIMKHVLMVSLVVEYADIVLDCESTALLQPMELVELQSVQDTFLEMGCAKLPEAVVKWNGSGEGSDDDGFVTMSTNKDDAKEEAGDSNKTPEKNDKVVKESS